MEFHTVQNMAEKSIVTGNWKVMFKHRFNENYFGDHDRAQYEKNLFEQLFLDPKTEIVITANIYPFNLGEETEQKVIWIRDLKHDPGIEKINELIAIHYPKYDRIVALNAVANRSIKTIPHYHAILKFPSPPIHLTKLLVFFRHGNRQPITLFPSIEKSLGKDIKSVRQSTQSIHGANLLPKGHHVARKFGSDLKSIYELEKIYGFLTDSIFLSSPVQRCVDTAIDVAHGLGLKIIPSKTDDLKYPVHNTIYQLYSKEMGDAQMIKFKSLANKLQKDLGHDIIEPMDFYDYYSSLICYRDIGIDTSKFINEHTQVELNKCTEEIYNTFYHYYATTSANVIEKVLHIMWNHPNKLILGATHDNLVFALAKYFANKIGVTHHLELPDYLANFRVELWSDNITRVYYNNVYLGHL